MASGKRQPSKQKRTNQNRQQRAARQARTTNAGTAGGSGGSGSSSTSRSSGSGSLLGRLRGAAAPAPRAAGPKPGGAVDRINRSTVADRSQQPVGYRAALTGLLAACAAVVVSFFITSPVDADGDVYATRTAIVADWADTALAQVNETPDATGAQVAESIDEWMPGRDKERMFLAYFPASLAVALPVLGAFLVFRAVRLRSTARAVTRAMYATLLGSFLTLSLLQFFLPTVIAVSVAGFQVRKAEMTAARAAAEDAAGDGPAGDDDVIDAEVVDEVEVVEEVDVVDVEAIEPVDEPPADEKA